MPTLQAMNVVQDPPQPQQQVEFIDALSGKAHENVNIKVSDNKEDDSVAESRQSSNVVITLPEVNWLKLNPTYLDGRTAFKHWQSDIHGNISKNVNITKTQFEFMLACGYEIIGTESVDRGNYIMMFFRLKPESPRQVQVPRQFAQSKFKK